MNKKPQTYTEKRPWGKFEQFTHNEVSTVKIITVNADGELSIQYHHHRDEFWRVIEGTVKVRIGEKWTIAKKGDEFFIPRETVHALAGNKEEGKVLEISYGTFDEDDIVRLEDKYGRK
ncbi:MAG: phosphomannose isomerase type II C-terminal cupin domain [Candidatus Woesearchaeota archaeon]